MESIPNIIFIVPYRDREQHYLFFSRHMKMILEDVSNYRILYIHQTDKRQFNRGAMKNIGFMVVKNLYPENYKDITLVFNDVDTMPFTKNFLNYQTTKGNIKHFYGFNFTLGGIVSVVGEDFEQMNGFPNLWSWGYEDNELNKRALHNKIKIDRSQFYPILDKNILMLTDGLNRVVNKSDYNVYKSNTKEGINSIIDLKYTINDDTGFVDVEDFNTQREDNNSTRTIHNLSNGNVVFKNRKKYGNAQMKMVL
jgi:hypothetical protein